MSSDSKVLTGLMERMALQAAFAELATIRDADLLAQKAAALAQQSELALNILLSMLDTEDPQLRGGLGQVARHLDRERVVPALQAAARANHRSNLARLSALTILDRFLGEPIEESLLAGLATPDQAALQSLRELVAAMEQDASAILEYLAQLGQQPPEVAEMVVAAVPRLPVSPHLVTLLRVVAQGKDRPLAEAAIEHLGRLRTKEALAALESLACTLPPSLDALAARGARKLRLSGLAGAAGREAGRNWRALMSSVDGTGAQLVWFVEDAGSPSIGRSLGVIMQDASGIVTCFGSHETQPHELPPPRPPGHLHMMHPEQGAPWQLLEVPFDTGRRAVRHALQRNWHIGALPPVEYRWLSILIWEAGPIAETAESHDFEPCPRARTAALLDHPAFASWFWQADAARPLGSAKRTRDRSARITAIANTQFGPALRMRYAERLQAMTEWLRLAGEAEAAALCASTAVQILEIPPAESPFVRRLIGIGLDMAAFDSRSGKQTR